ncbi:hypothetical protein AWB73_06822 [Caballeronia turbans]|jgi:hypothetical protein|uniref:hypothetical protein n=1 Tax=Caballeronia sp. EK TaxID=2767469 RepID=UPI00074D006B|nr:hypothetical protein [Caballeronia sp. EK]MBC8641312.1 hypothetical protein [Caballeronia sp. EK]SAL61425.1 hypothetical protein AWB73_06822 [Caballeronia turbans]
MKSIVAKRNHQVPDTSADVPKRTSLEADRELAHIQKVVTAVRATSVPLPISVRYWKVRLHELRIGYMLLPVQLARLSALEIDVENIAQGQADVGAGDGRRVA